MQGVDPNSHLRQVRGPSLQHRVDPGIRSDSDNQIVIFHYFLRFVLLYLIVHSSFGLHSLCFVIHSAVGVPAVAVPAVGLTSVVAG